jgi:hypothetical protein
MNQFVLFALTTLIAVTSVVAPVRGQDPATFPQPQSEHEWLKQFVGQWESESEATLTPGQPPVTCQGSANSRMLGGFWIITESEANMLGNTVRAVQTIGYDPAKKKYVGSWVDSMLNHMWQYEGTVDAAGKKLTLEAEGPSFINAGKAGKFRDEYEFKSPDHIVITSSMQNDDGQWIAFMTGNIRRVAEQPRD